MANYVISQSRAWSYYMADKEEIGKVLEFKLL